MTCSFAKPINNKSCLQLRKSLVASRRNARVNFISEECSFKWDYLQNNLITLNLLDLMVILHCESVFLLLNQNVG